LKLQSIKYLFCSFLDMDWANFLKPSIKKILLTICMFFTWLMVIPEIYFKFFYLGPFGTPYYFVAYAINIICVIFSIILALPASFFHMSGVISIPLIPWNPTTTILFAFPLALVWEYILACLIFRKK